MSTPAAIVVLVSPAAHPVSGRAVASRADVNALDLAEAIAGGSAFHVLSAGDHGTDALSPYLALGCPTIELLQLPAGHDPLPVLARSVAGARVVVCGNRADGGMGSGLLPYLLAELLDLSLVNDVLQAQLEGDDLQLLQFLPRGMRRRLVARPPVVLTASAAVASPRRHAHARLRSGRVHAVTLPLPAAPALTDWQSEAGPRRVQPLRAALAQSGHARMLNAVSIDAASGPSQVVKEGTAVEKAQVLLAYLREHRLGSF